LDRCEGNTFHVSSSGAKIKRTRAQLMVHDVSHHPGHVVTASRHSNG